jgi:hypothetical protein
VPINLSFDLLLEIHNKALSCLEKRTQLYVLR